MQIPIDEEAWRSRGLTFQRKGGIYRFLLDGRSDVCAAAISGDHLDLFPERSVEHKALLTALGEAIPEAPESAPGFGGGGFGVNRG